MKENEKELERKKLELERREKEVHNREEVANKEKQQNKRVKSRTTDDLLFDKLRRMAAGTSNMSNDEDGKDYAEEDFSNSKNFVYTLAELVQQKTKMCFHVLIKLVYVFLFLRP